MILTGAIVNAVAVFAGSAVGLVFKKGLPERMGDSVMKALSLCVIYIGISGAFEGENVLIAILSMAIGTIIGELLDLNQIEFGQESIQMEHFDIVSTIENLLSNAEILFNQKEVTLIFKALKPVYVWGDVYMVEEVFTNYLSNAFNHIDGERIIEVTVNVENEIARISVFNTGVLIPDEDLDQIWIKFYKVDKARTREYGGSGVGLSIVKATMERLGQSYGVLNRENGVEFWFTLDASNSIHDLNRD